MCVLRFQQFKLTLREIREWMNWKQSIDSQANLSTIPLSRANGGELFILDNNFERMGEL
jgi:hypothetical protein